MRRILLAFRVFFLTLFDSARARQIAELLAAPADRVEPAPKEKEPMPRRLPRQGRNDAVTLLAALQREARFIDFVQESLAEYSDAQIGAAARDVHRVCGLVLKRLFDLQPVLAQDEGAEVEVPAGFDAGEYRLVGNVTGDPPFRGTLVHAGWRATICQLPEWSGSEAAAIVVAPAEVELA